jgi:hypothetical protein
MHPETLRRRACRREIPGARAGRAWVFLELDLAEWLRAQYDHPARAAKSQLGDAPTMLYRRPNSSKWWTRFTTPDGQEVRRSTGTEDKKAAEEYEARLKQELWRIARMGEKPRHTWQEAVLQWLAETEHKASRVDDLMHLRWLDPYLKDKQLDEIDKAVIESLKRQRQTEKTARRPGGVTPATVNRMLALIRSILRRAEREWEWLDKAPAVRLLAEPKRRVRWLTHEEAARLVAELPEHLADMARFSLATGCARPTSPGYAGIRSISSAGWPGSTRTR